MLFKNNLNVFSGENKYKLLPCNNYRYVAANEKLLPSEWN